MGNPRENKVTKHWKMDSSDASARAAILKAANFAAVKHKDQRSNEDETIPFINHPQVLQAAILHDIVEYGHATFVDLELGFGKEVANIIREVTPVEDGGTQTENSELSQSAKELLLADNLWYLTALDEKEARGVELTPEETQRFGEVAIEINRYRGANQDIEDMLDKLFAKRKVLLQGVAN